MRLTRLNLTLILGIMLILIIPITNGIALTNHGFQWGFEIGDRFDYRLTVRHSIGVNNMDFDYYIVVEDLPEINDTMTEIPRISESNYPEGDFTSFFYKNGTEISNQTLYFSLYWSAYPIGNWSFIEETLLAEHSNTSTYDTQVINNDSEWGLIFITEEDVGYTMTETIKYSKTTGTMTLIEMRRQNSDGSFYRTSITLVGDIPIFMIIGVGGAAIGLLVLTLVILKKRS